MNHPTWEDFQRLEQEQRQLKEEVRQLREQRTEEIRAVRVEVASEDVLNQLKALEQGQKEISTDIGELKIDAKAYTSDAAIFKNKVERIESDVSTLKTDIEQVKTIQNGHSKFFEEHGRRLNQTATKDDINQINAALAEILNRLPPKP
jgi:chromosome segregation ATPase